MKRREFEARLGPLGLALTVFQQSCYYGDSGGCSLTLRPYPSEEITDAKLVVPLASSANVSMFIDAFLVAAGVTKDDKLVDAIRSRTTYEGQREAKRIVVSSTGPELAIHVEEPL